MRRTLLLLVAVTTAFALAACGGGPEDGGEDPGGDPIPPEESMGFDEAVSLERARSYLGVSEDDVAESTMVRVMRRGEEHFAGTMDLRPGRFNLELDEDDDGTYRVTRVIVETPDGEVVVE